jgi:D-lactate dehydrogenase
MTKIKIAFFSMPSKERSFIKKKLDKKKYELLFYDETLDESTSHLIKDVDAVSVFIYSNVTKAVLNKGKKLKLISTRSTGFNHIDIKEAKKRNITVCNVPYYGENTVAEHTFALILALSRNLHKAYVRAQQSNFSLDGLRGFDLKGKTIGIIGGGSIGVHVIKMAKGFDMNVVVYDINKNHIVQELLDFQYVSLEELLKISNIISLHVPYNKFTHHLINMENLSHIKKGTIFINTARNGLIEPEALYHGIDKGIFGGVGLDVFEGEEIASAENQMLTKNIATDKLDAIFKRTLLLRRENVIITPHMAFDSVEAVERILQTTIENINGYFTNGKFNKVN